MTKNHLSTTQITLKHTIFIPKILIGDKIDNKDGNKSKFKFVCQEEWQWRFIHKTMKHVIHLCLFVSSNVEYPGGGTARLP